MFVAGVFVFILEDVVCQLLSGCSLAPLHILPSSSLHSDELPVHSLSAVTIHLLSALFTCCVSSSHSNTLWTCPFYLLYVSRLPSLTLCEPCPRLCGPAPFTCCVSSPYSDTLWTCLLYLLCVSRSDTLWTSPRLCGPAPFLFRRASSVCAAVHGTRRCLSPLSALSCGRR